MYSMVTIVDNVLCCLSCSDVSDSLKPHGLYSLLGSSVHGILQARILEWVAISSSRGSSWPRDWTWVFCIEGRFFTLQIWKLLSPREEMSVTCVVIDIVMIILKCLQVLNSCVVHQNLMQDRMPIILQ